MMLSLHPSSVIQPSFQIPLSELLVYRTTIETKSSQLDSRLKNIEATMQSNKLMLQQSTPVSTSSFPTATVHDTIVPIQQVSCQTKTATEDGQQILQLIAENVRQPVTVPTSMTTGEAAHLGEYGKDTWKDDVDDNPNLHRINNAVGGDARDKKDQDFVVAADDGGSPTVDDGEDESEVSTCSDPSLMPNLLEVADVQSDVEMPKFS